MPDTAAWPEQREGANGEVVRGPSRAPDVRSLGQAAGGQGRRMQDEPIGAGCARERGSRVAARTFGRGIWRANGRGLNRAPQARPDVTASHSTPSPVSIGRGTYPVRSPKRLQ